MAIPCSRCHRDVAGQADITTIGALAADALSEAMSAPLFKPHPLEVSVGARPGQRSSEVSVISECRIQNADTVCHVQCRAQTLSAFCILNSEF